MSDDLLLAVRQQIADGQLISRGARIVVGVSGGLDSVTLLDLLATLQAPMKLRLRIGHLDHAMREESADDRAFVETLGARYGIPVTATRRNISAVAVTQGWSLEDAARRTRYAFLLEVARTYSADTICVAHTADDQAETVLMRLLRGTGILGLAAMPPKRRLADAWLARPLLSVWRRDIRRYATDRHLMFREDPSNLDRRFLRNRVRHDLLPLLVRDYNPQLPVALVQLAEQCQDDSVALEQWAARQRARTMMVRPHIVVLSLPVWKRQPVAIRRQLLRSAIAHLTHDGGQMEFRHWLEVDQLVDHRPVGTILDLPGGVQLERREKTLVCR